MFTKLISVGFFIFLLAGPDVGSPDEPQPQSQEPADNQQEPNPLGVSTEVAPKPVIPQINEDKPEDNPKTNTKSNNPNSGIFSQKYWSNPITWFTLVLAIGTLFLWWETRKQAKITRDALISTKRAIMSFVDFVHEWHFDPETKTYWWTIEPRWQNVGDTPTKNLQIDTMCSLREDPLPDDFEFQGSGDIERPICLGPKGILKGVAGVITGKNVTRVREGKGFFYIWGTAHYNDVFEGTDPHITRFCFHLSDIFGYPEKPSLKGKITKLVFSYYGRHNCADEDCKARGFE